jgi:prolyl-tRNA editing enzyme YbaK/EbsC (Cys-tRNA(Pro) deacylase)
VQQVHANTARVVAAAAERGVTIDVHRFPEGTRTAAEAAAAIGCPLGAIAKSIVLASDHGAILVFTSGSNRVAYERVEAALGVTGVRRADADEVRAATGYPIGGTAPYGHPCPVPMLLDRDLLAHDVIWGAAGTPDTVFPIAPELLLRSTGAQVADVAG